jgi:hypothetical protein
LQTFVIGEAIAAKEEGEAALWHRQIQDASNLKRDWHQEAIKIVERDAVDGCGFTSAMEAVRSCDVRHVGDHACAVAVRRSIGVRSKALQSMRSRLSRAKGRLADPDPLGALAE